jgi:hypothetical protein
MAFPRADELRHTEASVIPLFGQSLLNNLVLLFAREKALQFRGGPDFLGYHPLPQANTLAGRLIRQRTSQGCRRRRPPGGLASIRARWRSGSEESGSPRASFCSEWAGSCRMARSQASGVPGRILPSRPGGHLAGAPKKKTRSPSQIGSGVPCENEARLPLSYKIRPSASARQGIG